MLPKNTIALIEIHFNPRDALDSESITIRPKMGAIRKMANFWGFISLPVCKLPHGSSSSLIFSEN